MFLMTSRIAFVWVLACMLFAPRGLSAQTWSGLGTTSDWTDAGNWVGGVPPANNGTANLVFGDATNPAPNANVPWSVGSILFNANAAPYTIGGSSLTLGTGGLTNLDSDTQGFANAIGLSGLQTWSATAGGFLLNGVVSQGSNQLTLAGPFGFFSNNAINGTGNLLLRDNALVSLSAASTASGNWTISQSDLGGSLSFSAANQLTTGTLTINQNGRLTLRDSGGAGTVTLANTMGWNGNRYAQAGSPIIEVAGANDTLRLTALIPLTNRLGIVKAGPGTLRYAPATLASNSLWSLGISQGVVELNQLPYLASTSGINGTATGDLDFLANSTLRVLSDLNIVLPSLTVNPGLYGYGFANVRVASGVTGTIEVASGAVFKTAGRTDSNQAFLGNNATLVLAGTDLASQFRFGVSNAGGTILETFVNRTIDLRGGSLSFFGVDKPFWPQTVDFTMKLNGGEYDGRNQAGRQSLPGNLVINDAPSASTPQVRAWTVSDSGGANSSYGNIIWNGTLAKVGSGDTLTFNRNVSGSGTGGYVSIATNAVLDNQGGIVTVAGGLDPFTDSFDPTRHVRVALAASTELRANRNIGIGGLTGSGTLTTTTAGTKTVVIEGPTDTTFSGSITNGSGVLNLAKAGASTQTFTTAIAHSGTTTINGGRIVLSGSGSMLSTSAIYGYRGELVLDNVATNNNNRLGDAIPIFLGLGTDTGSLSLLGNSAVSTTETVGVVTLNAGPGVIVVTPGIGQTATLTLSGLAQAVGGTLDFRAGSGTLGAGGATDPTIFITGQSMGLIGGWATVGTSFAEYDVTNGVRAFVSSNFNYDSSTVTLRNIDVNQTQTLTNNDAELSVRYVAAVDTDFGGFNVNIHNGGLLKADASTTTISNGTLTAGGTSNRDLTLSVTQGGTLNISAGVQNNSGGGVVSLVMSGDGTANLQSANTFSGDVYLNKGALGFAADSHLGNANNDVFFYGGTLRKTTTGGNVTLSANRRPVVAGGLTGTVDVVDQSLILGTGNQLDIPATSGFFKTGAGTLRIDQGNTTFLGALRIDAGAVELLNAQALGTAAVTLNGGLLRTRINGDATLGLDVVVNANSSIEASRFDGSSTQMTHAYGSLAINGTQLSVLASTGDYVASFTELALSGSASIATATGATLKVAGAVTGPGVTKTGPGTLVMSGTNPNTLSGSVDIQEGTLVLDKGNSITAINRDLVIGNSAQATVVLNFSNQIADTAAVTIGSGSQFNLAGNSETIGSLGSGSSTAVVSLGSGTLQTGANNTSTTFAGVVQGAGAFVKQGTGTMTLSGLSTYTGATEVQAGELRLGGDNRLAAATVARVQSSGRFGLNGFQQTVAGIEGSGVIAMGSGSLTTGAATNHTFSGSITGTGGYTHQGPGTQVLSGQNTYTGLTMVSGGTLALGRDNALSVLSSLTVGNAAFDTQGFSQTLASLDLTANATFDFGNLSSVLVFDDVSANLAFLNSHTLTIIDWTGQFETTGGVDQMIVMDGLFNLVGTTTSSIEFIINSSTYGSLIIARPDLGGTAVEVVPVPEPSTMIVLAVAGVFALTMRARRVHRRRAAPPLECEG